MTPNRTRLSVTALESRDCPATLAGLAQTLVTQTLAHARQLVNDVAAVEYYHPTVARQPLVNDLVALNNAATARNLDGVFAGTGRLLGDLQTEAKLITAYHLNQASPLAYQAVKNDLTRLVNDRIAEIRLIVAAQQTAQAAQRVQVQQQFHIPPISTSLASYAASQAKLTQLAQLKNQQESYFGGSWADSFGLQGAKPSKWAQSFGLIGGSGGADDDGGGFDDE